MSTVRNTDYYYSILNVILQKILIVLMLTDDSFLDKL